MTEELRCRKASRLVAQPQLRPASPRPALAQRGHGADEEWAGYDTLKRPAESNSTWGPYAGGETLGH